MSSFLAWTGLIGYMALVLIATFSVLGDRNR